jgi:hypothetical protein
MKAAPYLAYGLALLGKVDECLQCLSSTAPVFSGAKAPWYGYGAMRARAYLTAGERDEALTEVALGLVAAIDRNAHGYRAPLLRLEAELLMEKDPSVARARFEDALSLADALSMRPLVA